jgi:hypothetical protein
MAPLLLLTRSFVLKVVDVGVFCNNNIGYVLLLCYADVYMETATCLLAWKEFSPYLLFLVVR